VKLEIHTHTLLSVLVLKALVETQAKKLKDGFAIAGSCSANVV